MAGSRSEIDLDAILQRIVDMAFKSNGAGLTLAAVAASNIVQQISLSGWLATLPAWVFLVGLVFGYAATAFNGLHDLHFARTGTLLSVRQQLLDFEIMDNPSDEMKSIAESNRELAAEIQGQLETPARLIAIRRAFTWCLNLSLICFFVGVVAGLVLIASK